MTTAEVVGRLEGVRRENGGWVGRCPAHADNDPSLRVSEGRDGRTVLTCRAGCEQDAVLRALNLTYRDLFAADTKGGAPTAPPILYSYRDTEGHEQYQAVRMVGDGGKKTFYQRRPDGKGGWIHNLNGVTRILYRLPELIEAIALGKRIYLTEGEKDADRLAGLGLTSTCNPMGAGKWEDAYADVLRDAVDVVILADNDDAGRKHARDIAAKLPNARIVEFPELPEKGDVSDWLDRGHSLDELVRRCDPVRRLTPIDRTVSQQMAAENLKPIDAIPTHLPTWNAACLGFGGAQGLARGWHVVVAGPANQGKSMLALNLAYAALEAGRNVAYILLEGSQRDLLSRLYPLVSGENSRSLQPGRFYDAGVFTRAAQAFDRLCESRGSRLWVADKAVRSLPVVMETIREAVDADCTAVIVDYLQLIRVPGDPGVYEATVQLSNAISGAAVEHNVVTVGLSQFNRPALNQNTGKTSQSPISIHGLSGGAALENDADQVVIIDNRDEKRAGLTLETTVRVAKNRHGPPTSIPVVWDFRTFRVTEPPVQEFGKVNV